MRENILSNVTHRDAWNSKDTIDGKKGNKRSQLAFDGKYFLLVQSYGIT